MLLLGMYLRTQCSFLCGNCERYISVVFKFIKHSSGNIRVFVISVAKKQTGKEPAILLELLELRPLSLNL